MSPISQLSLSVIKNNLIKKHVKNLNLNIVFFSVLVNSVFLFCEFIQI